MKFIHAEILMTSQVVKPVRMYLRTDSKNVAYTNFMRKNEGFINITALSNVFTTFV